MFQNYKSCCCSVHVRVRDDLPATDTQRVLHECTPLLRGSDAAHSRGGHGLGVRIHTLCVQIESEAVARQLRDMSGGGGGGSTEPVL